MAHGMRFGRVHLTSPSDSDKTVHIFLQGDGNSISTITTTETLAEWIEDGIFKGTASPNEAAEFRMNETWPLTYAFIFAAGAFAGGAVGYFF